MSSPRVVPTLLCLLFAGSSVSCSTSTPRPAHPDIDTTVIHIAPPPEVAAATPRKLPRPTNLTRMSWFPPPALRLGMTGRVLVQFAINGAGTAESERVIGADASKFLQDSALKLIGDIKFNVASGDFNASDTVPFRVSLVYCIVEARGPAAPNCGGAVPFPGTESLVITGNPLGLKR